MEFINQLTTAVLETHPWHVPTTHFPIALTGVALLFLLLALWRRHQTLERAAFYNMGLAAASTLLAGITGFRDHLVRFEGDTPYASAKIFMALTLLLLATALTVARWRSPELLWKPATMLLTVLGFAACFALASTLGFLGGIILYGF
ncbi:MAG: DUF2231 domain-containing protein [Chloroflexi bacterium]|nr:MAG: DUF2231 domain-containing protein [Chloroflexota bacterium]